MKWILKGRKSAAEKMSVDLGISRICAQILLNRGINSRRAAEKFLNPSLEDFGDIDSLPQMQEAFKLIKNAVEKKERITVYGDYDCDGVMSTVILVKGLLGLGLNADYYIPDRLSEGYGLNMKAVKAIKDKGTDIIICCDNGISAIEECGYIKELGMKLIILDHHSPHISDGRQILPAADALIDMKADCIEYAFREYCAGGLCYRFISGLYKFLGRKTEKEAELFIFAAIAAICDMVPLVGENRVFAHIGLRLLNSRKNTNAGLREIFLKTGIIGRVFDENTVGYTIGPFINSAGRMDRAERFVPLFLSNDGNEIIKLAEELAQLNDLRKSLTEKAYENIVKRLTGKALPNVIIEYDEELHESLAGLAAGRIKERFEKPAIILTKGSGGFIKGSGRSVEGFDMFDAIDRHRELLYRFGGHKMAVGVTLKAENLDSFIECVNNEFCLTKEEAESRLYIDCCVSFSQIGLEVCEETAKLKPFGTGNSAAVFAAKGVFVKNIRFVGKNRNFLQFVFFDGEREMRGVGFGLFDKFKEFIINEYGIKEWEELYFNGRIIQFFADIVFNIEKNSYKGINSVQLKIVDFRKTTERE